MTTIDRRSCTALIGCLLTGCAAGPSHSRGGPATAWTDVTGATQQPLAFDQRPLTVWIFTTVDCPIANGYAPTIAQLFEQYRDRGAAMYLIHVDADVMDARVRSHAAEYGLNMPALVDREHELVRRAGASVTPEAVVFDRTGRMAYRGRINDRYADYGQQRRVIVRQDLADAIEAVLAGRPAPHARTPAIGCDIPPLTLSRGANCAP